MRAGRLPVLVGALLAFCEGSALGQMQEFTVQRFEPAPGKDNFLGVESLRMEGNWGWAAGMFFNYARDPFRVQSCVTATTCGAAGAMALPETHVVHDMMTWDLLAALNPRPWLQIGLRVPLSYVNGDGLDISTGAPLATSLHAFGAGDPYLEAKVRFLGDAHSPIALGVAADIAFAAHSSSSTNFIGDASPVTGGIRGILDGQYGRLSYGANLRALLREDATVGVNQTAPNITVGPELRYGAAVGVKLVPVVEVMAEASGGSGFQKQPGTNTLEIDGALRFRPEGRGVTITAGGGAGAVQGVGVPVARGFAGVVYSYEPPAPKPVVVPEHVEEKVAPCPVTAKNPTGSPGPDGACPDEHPDRDKDGIPDEVDKCPDAGGPDVIRDEKSPYYGCPDRDHDGIPDSIDKCPDVPEPHDDLFDGSGCPHVRDTDHDGIPDSIDKCPTEPETYNGFQDDDGCPDQGPTTVEITETSINIHDRVEFALSKDKIQGKKSFQVLDAVAGILKAHKEVQRLEVQGHTDNAGGADQNRTLSQKRAEAVVTYLVQKGIEAGRLVAKGYGPDKPIADNKTASGRQKNRRVEFSILQKVKPGSTAPATPPAPAPATPPQPAPAAPAPAQPAPAAPPPRKP